MDRFKGVFKLHFKKGKALTAQDVFNLIYAEDDSNGSDSATDFNNGNEKAENDHRNMYEKQSSSFIVQAEIHADPFMNLPEESSIILDVPGVANNVTIEGNVDDSVQVTAAEQTEILLDIPVLDINNAINGESAIDIEFDTDGTPTESKDVEKLCTREVRKTQRATGKAYKSARGKIIPERSMGEPCNCRNIKCEFTSLTDDDKEAIFTGYYGLGDKDLQHTYLYGLIARRTVKRRYVGKEPKRDHTFEYSVNKSDGRRVVVCKKAFASVHGLKFGTLNYLCDQIKLCATPKVDMRGKHSNRPNRILEKDISIVKEHICSIPKHQSHYSRRSNPDKVYISSDLDIAKLHRLYKKQCEEKGVQAVKYHKYRQIFTTDFNVGFGAPRSDTCKICDESKIRVNSAKSDAEKRSLEAAWNLHLRQADAVYTNLHNDAARVHDNQIVIAFDLQQALPSPVIPSGIVFYLRQLWTYNFCVHNCKDNSASMFMWSENIAGRGSSEIASCLYRYLDNTNANSIIAYSDNCCGQNKNFGMVALFWYLVQSGKFKQIDHKFLITGHTFLPCDRDFGLIEKIKRKRENIFLPSDWVEIVRPARPNKPFTVFTMEQEQFFEVKTAVSNIINRKVTTDGEKVRFSEIRWFRFDKSINESGYSFKYTYSDIEPWKKVSIVRRGRIQDMERKSKYHEPRPINPKKKADLMKLLTLIPESARSFYKNLLGGEENDDVELLEDDSDAE